MLVQESAVAEVLGAEAKRTRRPNINFATFADLHNTAHQQLVIFWNIFEKNVVGDGTL